MFDATTRKTEFGDVFCVEAWKMEEVDFEELALCNPVAKGTFTSVEEASIWSWKKMLDGFFVRLLGKDK